MSFPPPSARELSQRRPHMHHQGAAYGMDNQAQLTAKGPICTRSSQGLKKAGYR